MSTSTYSLGIVTLAQMTMNTTNRELNLLSSLDAVNEEKVLEKLALNVTGKYFVIISKVSLNQQFVV